MVIDLPRVKLQNQTVRAPLAGVKVRIPEPFVFGSTMAADAREKSLVPAARGLNVAAVDQGLGAHESTLLAERRLWDGSHLGGLDQESARQRPTTDPIASGRIWWLWHP